MVSTISKNEVISFCWQHIMLLMSLTVMTLGVALCVRSDLGSSVISSCPLAFTVAGENGLVPPLSLGTYTNILNFLLVMGQIAVLRRRFQPVQLLQLVIGFVFGALIDMNMALTATIAPESIFGKIFVQLLGCTVMAIGIALEVRCASITMPGEGLPIAISKVTGMPFAKVKIRIDIALVALAVASCYVFFGQWRWNIVGVGTLLAMVYVGMAVKFLGPHLGWFDRMLAYQPGFRRYLYGLAKYIKKDELG